MEKLDGNTPRDICSISCKEGPLAVSYNCFTNELFNPSDFVDRFTLTKGRSLFVESIRITPQQHLIKYSEEKSAQILKECHAHHHKNVQGANYMVI